jgi:hypothetical protein
MKKTINLVLVTICCFTISFTAQAQKSRFAKPAATAAAQAQLPSVRDVAIVAAMNNLPRQNKNLAQFTGTIKIDSDSLFIFEHDDSKDKTIYTYMIYLHSIQPGVEKNGIKLTEYDFSQPLNSHWYKNVVVNKVNDRLYNYTIYNVPLNTGVVIAFHHTAGSTIGVYNGGLLSKMSITNAFTNAITSYGFGKINASPNYQATIAGQVLTLPTVTISNPITQTVN